jgi:diguanylate cyclase (GGDEF)-like protein
MTIVEGTYTEWDAAAMLDALPERVNRYRVSDLAITYCNAAWAAQYHVEPAAAIGRPLDEFLSADELEGLHTQLALLGPDTPVLVDSVARAAPNAPGQWLEWVDRYLVGPEGPEVLSVGRDVTERHLAELELAELQERLAALALRDPLTGLANRRLLDELLDAELARTLRAGVPLAVAYIDLDGLKVVNDTYGHDAGDVVLREAARRLVAIVRGADVVARLGGDEFVVVFEPKDPNSEHLIDRIDELLGAPIVINADISVSCPASIGTADTRTVGHDPHRLLAAADDAMYQVKRARRAVRGHDSPPHQPTAPLVAVITEP